MEKKSNRESPTRAKKSILNRNRKDGKIRREKESGEGKRRKRSEIRREN